MFLKRHFKPLLELKMFQANSDLNNIIIQNQSGVWSYRVKYGKVLYQKTFYTDTENPSNNFSISFNLNEFLSAISKIHGSQQIFKILDTGEIEIYRKKNNILINTVKLSSTEVLPFIINDDKLLNSIKNKESVIKLCKACKRFSCELDYYTGFNRIALFIDNGLRVFSTDGLHSLEFLLSKDFKQYSDCSSFYLGKDYQQSQECIKILENFLTYSDEILTIELYKKYIVVKNCKEQIVLPLFKNEEFSSTKDIYDSSEEEFTLIDSNNVKSILKILSKKDISQYRKEHDIKEAFKTTCEMINNNFIFNKKKIELMKIHKHYTVCVYHLIEFLNPQEEYKLYSDRLEGIMSILYF